MSSSEWRPVWAEISSARLCSNFELLRATVESQAGSDAGVLAVVKADAYGHGAALCAPILAAAGAEWLGVTSAAEGVRVRQACSDAAPGSKPRILVMCGLGNGEAGASIDHALTPVVWESFHLDALEHEARRRGAAAHSLPVHLEIDTGMARQGVAPGQNLDDLLQRFTDASPLRLEGVLTHFASPELVDSPQNRAQMASFERSLAMVAAQSLRPQWVHAGNSSTVDAGAELARIAALARAIGARPMARPGLALYGHSLPLERDPAKQALTGVVRDALLPVLAWKTRIVSLRDVPAGSAVGYGGTYTARQPMRLALLPAGYADGLRRELSCSDKNQGGGVLIGGSRAPIVGRVSMDLTIVDVSGLANAAIGDQAVLIGSQSDLSITAEDHARLAGTIPYEILCGISSRVPRIIA